ncbi:sensor histidine kinase [Anaerosinus sp.]|uniref:sensor histidine kinase n=1 Tax=Selenobaculum sp. TaxID=3074374 RepID=UPI0015AACCA2
MINIGIKNRITYSFLLLVITSLTLLGFYLLHYFYTQNLENKTQHLITNAKIIELTLEQDLYNQDKRSYIETEIRRISNTVNLRITILDAQGYVLADSWESPPTLDNHLNRSEIQGALSKEYATSTRYSDTLGQNMLYVAIPVYKNNEFMGIVRTATTLTPIENNYETIKQVILSALLCTSLLSILLGIWLTHKNTKPILYMTTQAKKIANGDLSTRIELHSKDELGLLANTINQLTSSLEEKLHQINTEAKKLSLILENMDNAVILLDASGNVIDANKQAKLIFQIKSDLFGKHSISVIGSSLLTQAANEVLHSLQPQNINITTKLNNIKQTYQVFLAPFINNDQKLTGVLSVFHDITTIQENYERQVDFVSNASHELATPLTSIQGFTETLLDGALADPELSYKFVDIIHTEAQRMNRLIKDLLLLAKLDSAEYRRQVKKEPLSLYEILNSVKYKLSPQFQAKNQTFLLLPINTDLTLHANYDWILQVIINLGENAIKYTPNDGEIILNAWEEDQTIYISIKDNGIGIAASHLPFIFERFYRVDKARSRNAGGSGLGLSLVRFIVEILGGKIDVTSELNKGTTFILSFRK